MYKKILEKIKDMREIGYLYDEYTLDILGNYISHLDMELVEETKLIKALELGVEKENKAYKLGYDKGWKECVDHCIANGIPNNF